jgi:hypothetical protein
MKRPLSKEEKIFITEALSFYDKYGPCETVVGQSFYPGLVGTGIVKWDKSRISPIVRVLEEGPLPFKDWVKEFFLPEVEFLEDTVDLIQALQEIQKELIQKVLKDYNDTVHEYENRPNKKSQ